MGPNPAFLLQHPDDPTTLYAATERIDEDGEVLSLRLHRDGDAIQLNVADRTSARGKSTCYLALDASRKWLRALFEIRFRNSPCAAETGVLKSTRSWWQLEPQ